MTANNAAIDSLKETSVPSLSSLRKELIRELPKEAFLPTKRALIAPTLHTVLVFACFVAIANTSSTLVFILLSLIAGHSVFCIGNHAHYISHHIALRNKPINYIVEAFFWAISITPATVWAKIHNQYHHRNTNRENDTFRYFTVDERRKSRTVAHFLCYPNKHFKYNPLTLISYFYVLFSHVLGALFPRAKDASSIVPTLPSYTAKERAKSWFELVLIAAIQVGIFSILDQNIEHYLLAFFIVYSTAVAITSLYLFTQHSLLPMEDDNHPLISSMSVKPNSIIDWLHANVSYHVEHHIFESMNYKYYPMMSEILKNRYGKHYQMGSMTEIWKNLQKIDIYKTPA